MAKMNTRLDTFLTEKKGIASREKAKQLISGGSILVNGKAINKVSYKVKEHDLVEINESYIYVSRSAHKLLAAIERWNIDVDGRICLDIGSSTGGFTEVLLQRKAKKVYAVDVGTDQLHVSLKKNPCVVSIEGTDIRKLDKSLIKEKIDIIVIDVSFISIFHILNLLKDFGVKGMQIFTLIKPQFEVGKEYLKKGIVKDNEKTKEVVSGIKNAFENDGYQTFPIEKSPLKGKEGNQEFLLYAVKK